MCIVCKEEKQINCFVKDKSRKDGVRNICKKCRNLKVRKTPLNPVPREGYKFCTKCKNELKVENFAYRKNKYFSWCKECEHSYDKNKYNHKCIRCGYEYRSGKKSGNLFLTCYRKDLGGNGAKILNSINWAGENNPMYGIQRFGDNNPNYDPHKSDEERELGRSIEGYGLFISEVYKRDNHKCIYCGDNKGGNLNAHHLDGYSWCKEKRLDINNAVTLCEKCHMQFHKLFGFRNNTKQQFDAFIKNKLIPR